MFRCYNRGLLLSFAVPRSLLARGILRGPGCVFGRQGWSGGDVVEQKDEAGGGEDVRGSFSTVEPWLHERTLDGHHGETLAGAGELVVHDEAEAVQHAAATRRIFQNVCRVRRRDDVMVCLPLSCTMFAGASVVCVSSVLFVGLREPATRRRAVSFVGKAIVFCARTDETNTRY